MDADETYEKKLLKKLKFFISNNIGIDAFAFPRKNYIDGKLTSAYPDRQIRLFLNNGKIKYKGRLHEQPVGWKLIASPIDLHIIHKKSSKKQKNSSKKYKQIEKQYKEEIKRWYIESRRI